MGRRHIGQLEAYMTPAPRGFKLRFADGHSLLVYHEVEVGAVRQLPFVAFRYDEITERHVEGFSKALHVKRDLAAQLSLPLNP